MNIKREVLKDLGLEELIGSCFEELITIRELKAMEEIIDIKYYQQGALYLYSGFIKSNIYSSEGREIHRYFEEGSLIGISESLSDISSEEGHPYGIDFKVIADSVIVCLPFKEILNGDFKDSREIYRKLFDLIAREKISDTNSIVGRMIYSDEEFLLKALEYKGSFDIPTPELAKALNMGLRNLQRYLKNYSELGIIEKGSGRIAIKDIKMFNEYMEKILK